MTAFAKFTYFSSPIEFPVRDIEGADLAALVLTGIVNPTGPTLSFVATVGMAAVVPVIYAMLNPFRCEVQQIGTYSEGGSYFPDQEFATLSRHLAGCCPTLVLTSLALNSGTRLRITENVLAQYEDLDRTFEEVRRFFGNPIDRVSRSMGINVPDPGPQSMDVQSASWSELACDPRHIWPELRAFMVAWDGAISRTGIPEWLKASAFSTERVKALLFPLLNTVWMPQPIRSDGDRVPLLHSKDFTHTMPV